MNVSNSSKDQKPPRNNRGACAAARRMAQSPAGGLVCAACIVTLVLSGCYTVTSVPAQNLPMLARGGRTAEMVLRDSDGRRVRLGPNSKIRFVLADGHNTEWIEGRRLQVSDTGVYTRTRTGPYLVARWNDIHGAEVRNLSGGKTYGAIVASAILVGVLIVLIAGGGKGGGGKGAGKLFSGIGRGVARGPRVRVHPTGPVRVHPPGPVRVGVGISGPHYHVHPAPHPVDQPAGQPPGPETAPPPPGPPGSGPGQPYPPPPGGAADHHAAPAPPVPMFSPLLRRRATFRFMGILEGGSDFLIHDGMNAATLFGIRFWDTFELAGGARFLLHRPRPDQATGEKQDLRGSWMAVGRLGVHLDLDSRRWVALPLGVDVGGGHSQIYVKMNLGLRVRVTRWLSIGLYPFNPTYIQFKDKDLKRRFGWWTFPSNMDLIFAL